jgi:hypothetical protein
MFTIVAVITGLVALFADSTLGGSFSSRDFQAIWSSDGQYIDFTITGRNKGKTEFFQYFLLFRHQLLIGFLNLLLLSTP